MGGTARLTNGIDAITIRVVSRGGGSRSTSSNFLVSSLLIFGSSLTVLILGFVDGASWGVASRTLDHVSAGSLSFATLRSSTDGKASVGHGTMEAGFRTRPPAVFPLDRVVARVEVVSRVRVAARRSGTSG